MRKYGLLGTSALGSVAFFTISLASAAPALAQATAPAEAEAGGDQLAQADTAAAPQEEAITVVGSRIRRNEFNTAEPITVITRDEATQAGFNSVTEILQSNAVTGGSAQINNAYGGYVTAGGPGANTLGLRGLGPSRTLILLNGHRVAPAGTRGSVGAADLNVLPTAMIDRVEVLKAGASSIYGSDAVAGVVNIVTRNKVNGITLEGQHDVTQDGGGNSYRYSTVFGFNADRFHVAGSLEYYRRQDLKLNQRDWALCQTDYFRKDPSSAPGTGDYIDPRTGQPKCYPITGTGDNGVTINTIGTSTAAGVGAPGSVGTSFNRFRPNAAVTTGVVGYEGVGGGANSLNVRDTFDRRTLNQSIISPAKVYTGYLQGGYELQALGNAELYGSLLVNQRKSSQVGFRQLSLDYVKGSPLIPAGLQFSTVGQKGFSTSNPNEVIGVRAFIGYGNYDNSQEVNFWKADGGLRGDFALANGWRYDLYLSRSKSDATYSTDQILTNRLAQSTDVVQNANGTFSCRNPIGGCVAAPALTPAVVGGQLPQAWINFIEAPAVGTTKYWENTANLTLDGPLFALPGGNAQAAVGVEYRKAHINDQPAPDSVIGNLYNFTTSAPTVGSDNVWEAFGEVELPILRNQPLAHDLTVNASGRYTHYASYGGQWTYKFGGIYSPVKWFSLRGSYGTSYRAPALYEQFLGATSGFLSANGDPCNNYGAAGTSPTRAANCKSEGLPTDFLATSSISVLNAGGAASGLKAETSTNWSVGGVLQPRLGDFGDLSFAVDYYDIRVRNGVSQAGASNILSLCYDDPQFRAGGGFCRLASRTPGSNQLIVNNNYVNLATDVVRGLDYNLRYSREIGPGTLRIDAQVQQYFSQANKLFAEDALDELNGTLNNPKMAGTVDLNYHVDRFNIRYGVDWVKGQDSTRYVEEVPGETIYTFKVPDYFTHYASVQYRADKFQFLVGVRNLFDKKPPQISSLVYNRIGNAPLYSGYDFVGRTFFVNVSTSF
jgi:outer membrane receptor protein involved in Fe transport